MLPTRYLAILHNTMGISNHCAKFLLHSLGLGVSYKDTIMLGRQVLYVSSSAIRKLAKDFSMDIVDAGNDRYAESFFKSLGAQKVDSLDYSGYEHANIIHDLNQSIGGHLKGKYSVVFDGGTLEHVFNFPVAIRNCMDLLQVGGHFVSITPANNQMGHGFYQFSPELFFSIFTERTGFEIKSMLMRTDSGKESQIYQVADPHEVNSRVSVTNSFPTFLMVVAKKIANIDHSTNVYQSDYECTWQVQSTEGSFAKRTYRSWVPVFLRDWIWGTFRSGNSKRMVSGLGNVNPKYFRKIDY